MRRRYKVVLNIELDDPDQPHPAGGDYTHLNRIGGIIHALIGPRWEYGNVKAVVTLDKVIDKGEIEEREQQS
jgi:hypothetical protein